MKIRIENIIEDVLKDNIKFIEDGEHTYLGNPQELISNLTDKLDNFLRKEKPHLFRRSDDIMIDLGRYQYKVSLKEILELEDLDLRSTTTSN